MPEGVVKWFNGKKGFGFIQNEEGTDIYVHFSDVTGDQPKKLKEGDKVTYDIVQGEMGPKAAQVIRSS